MGLLTYQLLELLKPFKLFKPIKLLLFKFHQYLAFFYCLSFLNDYFFYP